MGMTFGEAIENMKKGGKGCQKRLERKEAVHPACYRNLLQDRPGGDCQL